MQNNSVTIQNVFQIIFHISIMDLKVKYKGTVFGFIWSVVEPLVQLGVLYIIFSSLRSTDEGFVIYLFSGLIIIHLFSRGTTSGLQSLAMRKTILLSINIPKIIFPISSVMTNVWMFGIELVIFFLFMFGLQIQITSTILFLPIVLLILIILIMGISILLSILRLYFKDIQTLWGILTMSLIFITPVFWHVKDMPENVKEILMLNPLAVLMEMMHKVILFNTTPSLNEFVYASSLSIGILFGSYIIYKKVEKRIAERL